MNAAKSLTPSQLSDFLLNVAVVRPVFIWGPPGIGKSSLVNRFAEELGLPCVSLLGSQLAPEDLIGVPQITDGVSRFCPPSSIARSEPYLPVSRRAQRLFPRGAEGVLQPHSRAADRRVPLAGGLDRHRRRQPAQDSAIVKPMSSALLNRMVHVHLQVSHRDWMAWAHTNGIHPHVLAYLDLRSDHLWSAPPKHEEPFSTPPLVAHAERRPARVR